MTDVFHLLREKEKAAGVDPDPEIDAFLKASLQEGKASSASTSFIIRLLGLEVIAPSSELDIGSVPMSSSPDKRLGTSWEAE